MKDKKAVSVIIGYVMLISMAIALSILVFAWLRFYVSPGEELECPSDVAIVLQDYAYDGVDLDLRLKNKGLFSIDGFFIRVSNRSDAEVSNFLLEQVEVLSSEDSRESLLKPNEVIEKSVNHSDSEGNFIEGEFTFVEVLPYIYEDGNRLICGSVSRSIVQKDFAGSSSSEGGDGSSEGEDGSGNGDVSCDCGPGQICGPEGQCFVPAGDYCTGESDCQESLSCVDNTCVECVDTSECGDFEFCSDSGLCESYPSCEMEYGYYCAYDTQSGCENAPVDCYWNSGDFDSCYPPHIDCDTLGISNQDNCNSGSICYWDSEGGFVCNSCEWDEIYGPMGEDESICKNGNKCSP